MKKNNHMYFLIILISFLFIFCFNIKVSAATNKVNSCSSCSGVTKGTPNNSNGHYYKTALEGCSTDTTVDAPGGMYECNEGATGFYIAPYVHEKLDKTNNRKSGYIYMFIRIDTWGNLSGTWNTVSGLNIPTCPDMKLNFDSTMSLDSYFLKGYKNMKVISAESVQLDNSTIYGNNLTFLKDWSVSDYTIKAGNTPTLTDGDGNVIQKEIKVNVDIPKLSTNSLYGLGYNGTNGYLCEPGADGICTKKSRALHYYIPIQINVEYDNKDYKPNPCKETIDGVTSAQYAYQNPGECCDEYPETCCKDVDYIQSIKNIRPDVYNFCCWDTPTGQAYYGTSGNKGLPMLNTFKADNLSDYYTRFYSSNPSVEGICKTCYDVGAYYIYEENGEYKQSECCKNGIYKDVYKDSNCKLPTCSAISNQCSSSEDYFINNPGCCCDLYPDDERCSGKKWDDEKLNTYGLSCNVSPYDATYGSYAVATGFKSVPNGSVSENITFTGYDTYNDMKSNIIKAGTGFEYDVDVRHRITKIANRQYDSNCSDSTCAENFAKGKINEVIEMTSSEINAVNNTSTKFDFISSDKKEDYELSGTILPSSTSEEGRISVSYIVCYPTPNGTTCKTVWHHFDHAYKKTYDYTYTIKFKNKYINKFQSIDNENVNIVTETLTSSETNYINGGTKFYTETTTTSGIYDFNIKLDNASGVTGTLSNKNNGFACQYGVVNKIKKDGRYDYSITGGPVPPPDKDGRGFYVRQISLSDPFPNSRTIGENWRGNVLYDSNHPDEPKVYAYITEKNTSVYTEEPMYEVSLDADLINQIKQYNEDNNYDYGWSSMESKVTYELAPTSSFIDYIQNNFGSNINIHSDIEDQREQKVGDFK